MEFDPPDHLRRLKADVRRMVQSELQPHDADIEETGVIPQRALDAVRRMGLFGAHTPRAYGGLGLEMLGNCLVIEEMAKAHIAYFYTYSMNVHIASKGIELGGSEEQRRRWLPDLASGRRIGCYALTEEGAGSDAAAVETTATRRGDRYILNGRKRYITNAPIADLFTVFATTGTDGPRKQMSAFIVEKGTPGLTIGRVFRMAGGHGSLHAEVAFEDCPVPVTNRLGDEGDGLAIAMRCLDAGRINWAAYCVGAAERLLDMSINHLATRRQFGKPLIENQGLQWMLADMAVDLKTARLTCYEAAWRYEREPQQRASIGAMAKLSASEMAFRTADRAVQLFGGEGYRKDLPIERIWRELRAVRILEGTSEIMRHIIARELIRAAQRANNPEGAMP